MKKIIPATIKWEGVLLIKHLRWVLIPAAVLTGVFALLTLPVFGLHGNNAIWFLYFVLACVGIYVCAIFPQNFIAWCINSHALQQRLIPRPIYIVIIIKTFYNVFTSLLGLGIIYIAALLHERMGLGWFEIMEFLTAQHNLMQNLHGGFIIGMVYTTVFFLPAFNFLHEAATNSRYKWAEFLGGIGFIILVVILGGLVSIISRPDFELFNNLGIAELIAGLLFVLFSIAAFWGGAWLYDNRVDGEEVDIGKM
jgi:hypothetical protein